MKNFFCEPVKQRTAWEVGNLKRSESIKRSWKDQTVRRKRSVGISASKRRLWSDAAYRARQLALYDSRRRSAAAIVGWSPEKKQQQSQRAKSRPRDEKGLFLKGQ